MVNTLHDRLDLNPQQRAAVEYFDTPLLLIAGAGSGKTSVLTNKIAYIAQAKGISPNRILAITFTKKSANEMSERTASLLGRKPRWVSTFHSFCVKILREDIGHLGKAFTKEFVIYDIEDTKKILKDVLNRLNFKADDADTARGIISKAKQEYRSNVFDRIASLPYPQNAYAPVAEDYQKTLEQSNALDYDDIIYYTVQLLISQETVRQKWQNRFDAILVDEFQDTNDIQYTLIQLLYRKEHIFFAVGDYNQCIYTWRGSKPSNLFRFLEDFRAVDMKLEKNYRSTKKILTLANEVVSTINSSWSDKVIRLHTDNDAEGEIKYFEAENGMEENIRIAEKITSLVRHHDYKYSDIAILIRMAFLSRGLESAFMSYGIPYTVVSGLAFYERAEVKDLLAYLRLMANPKDKAAFERIINVPSRAIGDVTISNIRQNYKTNWLQALKDTKLSAKQQTFVTGFISMIEKHTAHIEDKPYSVLMDIISDIRYLEYIKQFYKEDYEDRIENISELSNVLKTVEDKEKKFSEFLEENILSSEQDKIGSDDTVKIMTCHAAKGLEFPVIFAPALEEEVFPAFRSLSNSTALEEERRLFYVTVTRAKERLYLSSAETRYKFGNESYMTMSRFLEDIEHLLKESKEVFKESQPDKQAS